MKFRLMKDDSKKSQIFEATFACIYKQGAKTVTTRDIANKAGVSRGLLHYHFKSKQALLVEFLQTLLDQSVTHLKEAVGAKLSPEEKLEVYFRDGWDFVKEHGDVMIVISELWSLSIADADVKKIIRKYIFDLMAITESILIQGEKDASFKKIADKARSFHLYYHAFILGMGLIVQMDRRFADPEAFQLICENLKRMALKGNREQAQE